MKKNNDRKDFVVKSRNLCYDKQKKNNKFKVIPDTIIKFSNYFRLMPKTNTQLYYKVTSGNQQFSSKQMANFFEPVKVLNVFLFGWNLLEVLFKDCGHKIKL